MTVTLAEFRAAYPQFTDDEYPTQQVEMRLTLADKFISASVFCDEVIRNHAICLYVAHYLTASGANLVGGKEASLGVVSSKSVDGASVSYDTGSSTEMNAGFWNATSYGRELFQLLRVMGAGARQL